MLKPDLEAEGKEENIPGQFSQVLQMWGLIPLDNCVAEDHDIDPQLRFSRGFSMMHDSIRPGEGKIKGREQEWAWWYSLMVYGDKSHLGSVSSVLSALSPMISLCNPCC